MKSLRVEIPEEDLRKILKDVIEELIKEHPKLIKEILEEAIEDIAMGKAIEEGLKTESVSKDEITELLKSKY